MAKAKRTSKKRRHSGRVFPNSTLQKEAKPKEIISECLEPQEMWSDWDDYRDSYRYNPDKTQIRAEDVWFAENTEIKRFNKKNKKLLDRRKLMRGERYGNV